MVNSEGPVTTLVKTDDQMKEVDTKALSALDHVVVHPLVLLSVVDHFNRMGKIGHSRRVVGILLGSWSRPPPNGILDISNSFAVPFDEEAADRDVWFLDHEYLETMYGMFKKVNAKERIVGWYHTGPKLHPNDIMINKLIDRYCSPSIGSLLVIIDAKPKAVGLPTEAYRAVEELHDDGSPTSTTFDHVPSRIGAEEAEEVGVEHLLRDIRRSGPPTKSTSSTSKTAEAMSIAHRMSAQLNGLAGLARKLSEIHHYLQQVIDGKLPINHEISFHLQDIFNLLPDVTRPAFVRSANATTNDQMVVIYIASLIRTVIALHTLIENKVKNRQAETDKDGATQPSSVAADAKKPDTEVATVGSKKS